MVGREIIKTCQKKFNPYNRYGLNINGLEWLNLSGDNESENEVYLIKFKPRSHSSFHVHRG